jgi:hypothetical protein
MKLKFVKSKEIHYDYSTRNVLRKILLVDMVINFKHRYRGLTTNPIYQGNVSDMMEEMNKMNGGISPRIRFGKQITMMDVDHKDFKDEIVEKLLSQKIAHSVIESSAGRYWIIADKFSKDRFQMAKILKSYINVDPKYIDCGRKQGFNLRAYPRKGYVPQVILENGSGSRAYKAYMKAWKKYWEMPHINWMVQEYLINVI